MGSNAILLGLLLCSLFVLPLLASSSESQVYVVYLGHHKGDKVLKEIEDSHNSYLQSVKGSLEEAIASKLYSYKHSINGFAAVLTPEEAEKLSDMEEVVSVLKSHPKKHVMHTTRSWDFIGLRQLQGPHWRIKKGHDVLSKAHYGKDVIVGLLDSGFWPESKSFDDEGMGPIPKRWKGECQAGDAFNSSHCNKKVIGARFYVKAYEYQYKTFNRTLDYLSPRDADGHGSHTASIATGREVANTSFMGRFAPGTASGGAPLARLAIYKACWAVPGQEKDVGNTCFEPDMLAAIDDAIGDGVDVLSISIGSTDPTVPYENDGIAVGALHALKHNITVVCAAGNNGPTASTLSNPAPWIITVGATTIDRGFSGAVLLGNGNEIPGTSMTSLTLDSKVMYPLVHGAWAEVPGVPLNITGQCMPNTLSPDHVKGKIVLCLRGQGLRLDKGREVLRAGGVGFILGNNATEGEAIVPDPHYLPGTNVGWAETYEILEYINSTSNPTATLSTPFTPIHLEPAPSMASFTSRGPNIIDFSILKPDVAAPGVNILAAWSGADPPTKISSDPRVVEWNFDSGTSMACPHVAGTAALVKNMHPHWSSAAIRSALMTSAGLTNNVGTLITDEEFNPADPFQFGAGRLRPTKAVDPGLVYDASYEDYLLYLCSGNFTNLDPSFTCPSDTKGFELNYPSIAVPNLNGTVTVKRTVTNVGSKKSVYFASVKPPSGYKVTVSPSMLKFKHLGQKKSFEVTFEAQSDVSGQGYAFGWLTWFDGFYTVRNPMAVSSS